MRWGAARPLWILCCGEAFALGCSGDEAATAVDAGVDATNGSFVDASPDARVRDASSDATRTPCPTDLSTFDAAWHPPTPFYQARCTQAQIDGFFAVCLSSNGTGAACAAFRAGSDSDCASCIVSAAADPAYGPIIVHKGISNINVAGCIANADRSDAGAACAAASQKLVECAWYACDCDPCLDPGPLGCEVICEAAAAHGVCAPFADAASCTNGYASPTAEAGPDAADAGLAARCLAGQAFEDLYRSAVPLFCGAAPNADAATD